MEIFGHDADHGVGCAVQRDSASDFLRIGVEAVVPEAVAEDRNVATASLFFFRAECTTHDGLGFERLKEIGTDPCAENSCWTILAGEIEICGRPRGEIFESGVLFAPIVEIRSGGGPLPALLGVNFPKDC